MRWLVILAFLGQLPLAAGTAADLARAILVNSFDRDECYRVRDLTLIKDDIRIYLTDGHLIFSKPMAGKRIGAVFTADVEGGDAELILLPPDRAERRSLAAYIHAPNLDEHFRSALFLFTGDDYESLKSQMPNNPANRKTPELGPLLDETWTPVLRNLSARFQTRLALDFLGGPSRHPGWFAGLFSSPKLGNFDVVYDPDSAEQILAGQVVDRDKRFYFDMWTSFPARPFRKNPEPRKDNLVVRDYRIEATIDPSLSLSAVTHAKVSVLVDGLAAVEFEIAPGIAITEASVDGRPAEVLQQDSPNAMVLHGGNGIFLVIPSEPLREGREYDFAFHHSGKVILDAGDRVFYVTARGNWYPTRRVQFANYDLRFRYPRDLDLVAPGDVVEDRTDGDWRITRRRTSAPIRVAAFNLGDYEHARLEHAGYTVDVCANRAVERALQPKPPELLPLPNIPPIRHRPTDSIPQTLPALAAPSPLERLQALASSVSSALEFMASKLGPPALPHLTVSPIPGAFGQGFPGLIYLSTLSYLKGVSRSDGNLSESQELFFQELLDAHETAHQWWGNRVMAATYRDNWLMEALANYTAMLYLEKRKGPHSAEIMLDSYRTALLAKDDTGQTVESAGPIILGQRLQNSLQPAAWRAITYGKGSWILQMLRRRMGDERFLALLADAMKRYDHLEITTEQFRHLAAQFLPPKQDDPALENFFDQWVYGTGIPALKLAYSIKGKAPALRLVGTLTQSDVDDEFTVLTPIEIQLARNRSITRWIRSGSEPVTFTVALQQVPLKVSLDPHYSVLRR